MQRSLGIAVWTYGLLLGGLLTIGGPAVAVPYYYFVDANTSDFTGEEFNMELNLARDYSAGGPTDNRAEIMSFAAYGTNPFSLIDAAGTQSGNFTTGIELGDATNGGVGRQNYSGTFGSSFSYVVGLSGSQVELQTPLSASGFMGHSLFLMQDF